MSTDAVIGRPEKIYLQCKIESSICPSEWSGILEPYYRLFEREIYEWGDVSFEAPQSIFSGYNHEKVDLGIDDWLNKDECEELARDERGDRRPLTDEQFDDLRTFGEIRVQSIQFPGKNHVWRINRLFQKGTSETYKDFQKDLSRVLRLVIVTMRNRIFSNSLSIYSSLRHILKGIYLLFDLLLGLPHNNSGNIEAKMTEECLQFLTCELNVTKKDQDKLSKFWDYIEQLSCLPKQYGADKLKEYFPHYIEKPDIPGAVYQFATPNRLCIDLRLMNTSLGLKCYDIVQECINEVEQSNWFLEFKNSVIERVYHESLPIETIEQNVLNEGMKAKANKIFTMLEEKCEVASIPESIYSIMIGNAKFHMICTEISEAFIKMWVSFKDERFEKIKELHPYRSMISSWMRKQLKKTFEEFLEKHQYTQLKMVIDRCCADDLRQHEYLLKRLLIFQKERRQLIHHELFVNSSFPDRVFQYQSKMVLPSYWKITPSTSGLRSVCYDVEKYKKLQWSTQYPFWRWINYFMMTYMLILTIGQFLLIKLPLKTRVSYLSLFRKSPFVTHFTVDQSSGLICPSNQSKLVPTLYSRLENLWVNVWKSRTKFECTPFTGLLDKSVARHFHRIWVIGFKGVMGTVGLLTFMPILCLLTSSLSVFCGVLGPLWIPFVSLGIFSVSVLIYDFEPPNPSKNRLFSFFQAILWHGFWCGIFQLFVHIILVTLIFPFLVVLLLILSALRFTIRSTWDALIFHSILKKYAHVPAANDFMTKRISGPGLAYEYEILVLPEHVLTGIRCLMEEYELELWLRQVTMIIQEPLNNYRQFIDKTLGPLNITLNQCNANICRLIEKESKTLDIVKKDYYKRVKLLNISPFRDNNKKEKLRMSSKNLKIALEKSEKLWNKFYQERLLPRIEQLNITEDSWWADKNVKKYDMKNLSLSNLSYLFGDQILSPIEECDEVFQLETNELTMKTYIDMFITEEYQDDLDKINILSSNWNRGVSMEYCQFKLRHLNLPLFDPQDFFFRKNTSLPSVLESSPNDKYKKKLKVKWIKKGAKWMKGKGKGYADCILDNEISVRGGSMEIKDLTLYHPVIICTLLHLRDRDNSMVHINHPAVHEGIQNCMKIPYDADFLENVDLVQSVDYSINSLEDIYDDLNFNNHLLSENC